MSVPPPPRSAKSLDRRKKKKISCLAAVACPIVHKFQLCHVFRLSIPYGPLPRTSSTPVGKRCLPIQLPIVRHILTEMPGAERKRELHRPLVSRFEFRFIFFSWWNR